MKQLRLLGEHLTDTPAHSTRSPEEWERHERSGHYPKLPDCPVCVEEQGPVVRHYAHGSSSLNTLHLDTGYWGDWSLDEKRYFIAAALRVEQDGSGILIPFFVPVENVCNRCFEKKSLHWLIGSPTVSRFKPFRVRRSHGS